MLTNYLKIAWRNLIRNRLYTVLNVLGLATGLSACWIIYRLVSYEFAFDQQHVNQDRTYRVVSRFKTDGKESGNAGVPEPLSKLVQTSVAGIERAVPFSEQWMSSVYVPQPAGQPKRFRDVSDVAATDAGFFSLFHYDWLAGTPQTALSRPDNVVLTRSRANRYFPGITPARVVGRSLTYFDTLNVTVTGIVADPVLPTSFNPQEIVSIKTLRLKNDENKWGGVNSGSQLLVRLLPNADPNRVIGRINRVSTRRGAPIFKKFNMAAGDRWHLLQPLADVHFGVDYGDRTRHANRTVLYGLMGLAGFILLLAIINYVNLSSAQVPQRAREIGIRKTLGSRSRTLAAQFLLETSFVTLLALAVAFGLAEFFLTYYGDLLPNGHTDYINWPQVVMFLVGLVVFVSVLSGWYPGWLITRFQPAAVLRGQTQLSAAPHLSLRKSLIVFQFLIAQVFIIGAVLVGQQLQYVLHSDMGFDREAVVTIPIPFRGWDNPLDIPDKENLRTQLARLPGVGLISLGNLPASQSFMNDTWNYVGKKGKVTFTLYSKYIDTAYLNLYELPLLAGHNLLVSDTAREFIINETALRAMGLQRPQDAIGQIITENTGKSIPIVGVVKDFKTRSFHENVPPVALMMDKSGLDVANIRLASRNPTDWPKTLSQIEKSWKTVYTDEPFAYEFYDQTIAQFYEQERTASRIVNLATIVAVLISCLGLFGLATFTAEQRTKEIGVRKVLGASVGSIVALLSKDFLKLVLIAIVIATPIAWYAMHRWLQDFAYKITIEWWVFAVAGLLAVGIALLTVSFQSIRAALMNPVKSLRSE